MSNNSNELDLKIKCNTLRDRINFLIEFTSLFKKLRPKEKDVLKELLYYSQLHNYDILMDYEVKLKIREHLKISEFNLNNLITALRKKDIIVGNKIKPYYLVLVSKSKINISLEDE